MPHDNFEECYQKWQDGELRMREAAGLAISEKMRAQITGLETAQKNAKDGISLVQTAECALTEVHDMLNRMVALATQSANGTYDDDTDRYQLQKKLDQLRSEINRIADSSTEMQLTGVDIVDPSTYHGDAADTAQEPAFKIDTGNFKLQNKTTSGLAASSSNAAFTVKLGDLMLDFVIHKALAKDSSTAIADLLEAIAKAGKAQASKVTTTNTGAKATDGEFLMRFGDVWMKAQATGNNIKFTYWGIASGTNAPKTAVGTWSKDILKVADGSRGDDAAKAIAKSVNAAMGVSVSFKAGCKLSLVSTTAKEFHAMVKTQNAVAGTRKSLPGVSIDLMKFLVDGAQLQIRDKGSKATATTYIFKTKSDESSVVDPNTQHVTAKKQYVIDVSKYMSDKTYAAKMAAILMAGGQGTDTVDGKKIMTGNIPAAGAASQTAAGMFRVGTDGATIHIDMVTGATANQIKQADSLKKMQKLVSGYIPEIDAQKAGSTIKLLSADVLDEGNMLTVGSKAYKITKYGTGPNELKLAANVLEQLKAKIEENGGSATVSSDGLTINIYASTAAASVGGPVILGKGLSLQIGDTVDPWNQLNVAILDCHTDIAEEMMAYTKNNILIQSAQAMLAQANQVPQGVLKLLQ